jgi:hypothetical protein
MRRGELEKNTTGATGVTSAEVLAPQTRGWLIGQPLDMKRWRYRARVEGVDPPNAATAGDAAISIRSSLPNRHLTEPPLRTCVSMPAAGKHPLQLTLDGTGCEEKAHLRMAMCRFWV